MSIVSDICAEHAEGKRKQWVEAFEAALKRTHPKMREEAIQKLFQEMLDYRFEE